MRDQFAPRGMLSGADHLHELFISPETGFAAGRQVWTERRAGVRLSARQFPAVTGAALSDLDQVRAVFDGRGFGGRGREGRFVVNVQGGHPLCERTAPISAIISGPGLVSGRTLSTGGMVCR